MSYLTSPEILIRPAQPGDAAFVAEMIYLSMGKFANQLFKNTRQPAVKLINNLVNRNAGVHPSVQGLGIGSLLLAFAEQKAQAAALKKCALVVGYYNQNAFRLYQRLGYQIVETVQHPAEFLGYHRMIKVI
jgi:GNAT superfamily N-acetyltransferase